LKKNDLIPAIIWIILGIAVAIGSYRLKLGNLANPGPGLMPFLLGIALLVCSFPVLIHSFLKMMRKTEQEEKIIWSEIDFKKLVIVLTSLIGYAVILEKIGFVTTTFLLLSILFKTVDSQKWFSVLIASILTVIITYFLFVVILKVELPSGFLGRIV
jgi:putative tricarboxylic transport membrane protein